MRKLSFFLGFTLVEVLVVISIVLILSLVSIPVFTSLIQNYRVGAVADNLYYSLQYARTEAVKRNANIFVSFSTGDSWCYGISSGSACTCTIANNCNLGATSADAPAKVTLSTTGLSSNTITFEPTHGAANASGSITFTLYGQSSLVKVNVKRLGNIQTCSTGISGYTAC